MGWEDGLRVVVYVILLAQLPIPVFWVFVHPFTDFWRGRARFAYALVGVPVWGLCAAGVLRFRGLLFVPEPVALSRVLLGFLLIGLDLWLMRRVESDLGWRRLVGLAELSPSRPDALGAGKQALSDRGIYGSMRHPRYAGMILSVTGAWLLAGTPALAAVLAAWLAMVLAIVQLEERELRKRFGAAYEEYARRVPRFLPRKIGR
ncbi:MAG TPA: methyltransferase [Candidatus Acidoferrales bacterium]